MAIDAKIIKRIRLLIPDNEPIYGDSGDEYLFAEDELEAFYEEGFNNTKCAAGLAMIAMGSSLGWTMRYIKNYETITDGAKVMKEFVAAGEALYERGLDEIEAEAEDGGIFDVVYPDFSGTERHPEGGSHGGYRIGGWLV